MSTVTFFIPDPDLERLLTLDPDRDWQQMRNSQRWMLQTFLRLSRAGHAVAASREVPRRGVVVFHAKHSRPLGQLLGSRRGLALVGVRGDAPSPLLADYEIVQNGRWADGLHRFFIPYWPQPALLPRDDDRGSLVRRVAFKGFDRNLHGYFSSKGWLGWLRDQGFEWARHSMDHAESERSGVTAPWHDYRDIDVVVAFRPDPRRAQERRGFSAKPATKLYNAWHAGVPAILGRELAYREQRRSVLDYIEIDGPEQAKAALLRLREQPELYRSMVANGRRRANEFSVERIERLWVEILFRRIPLTHESSKRTIHGRLPLRGVKAVRRWQRLVAGIPKS